MYNTGRGEGARDRAGREGEWEWSGREPYTVWLIGLSSLLVLLQSQMQTISEVILELTK